MPKYVNTFLFDANAFAEMDSKPNQLNYIFSASVKKFIAKFKHTAFNNNIVMNMIPAVRFNPILWN